MGLFFPRSKMFKKFLCLPIIFGESVMEFSKALCAQSLMNVDPEPIPVMSQKNRVEAASKMTAYRQEIFSRGQEMKFLSKLDPMLVLMLVVIFGVVITMSTQASTQSSVSEATAQAVQVAPGGQGSTHRRLDES